MRQHFSRRSIIPPSMVEVTELSSNSSSSDTSAHQQQATNQNPSLVPYATQQRPAQEQHPTQQAQSRAPFNFWNSRGIQDPAPLTSFGLTELYTLRIGGHRFAYEINPQQIIISAILPNNDSEDTATLSRLMQLILSILKHRNMNPTEKTKPLSATKSQIDITIPNQTIGGRTIKNVIERILVTEFQADLRFLGTLPFVPPLGAQPAIG